jgi:hypothetical protein
MRRSKIGIASLTGAARDQKTLIWLFRCWRSFPPQEIESRARGFERGDGNCNCESIVAKPKSSDRLVT